MKKVALILAVALLLSAPAMGQSLTDAMTNPTLKPQQQCFGMVYNGTTWDRLYGDATNGQWVNVKTWSISNASTNVAQFGGSNVVTGTGAGGSGVPRVTISNDSSLAANQSVNVSQVNGVTPLMGNGATGTGSPRVTIASDNTPFAVKIDQTTPGTTDAMSLARIGATTVVTGGVNGTLGVGGLAAHNAAPAGNPEVIAGYSWTDGSNPTATTAGNVTRLLTTTDGRLVTTTDHPKRFSCTVINSTATTLTAFGGSCAAPGAGLSLYITDIIASSSAAATTTTDQYLTLKSGTGGACGTGTAVVWASFNLANDPVPQSFATPIKVAANSELCWMHAAVGNKTYVVNGYIAP